MKLKLILRSFLPLLLGFSIYLLFRPYDLLVYRWLNTPDLISFINEARFFVNVSDFDVPDFIVFSLPDGLWIFSYVSFQQYIWKSKITKHSLMWILGLPFLAICHEFMQLIDYLPGTFDIFDIISYIFGTLLAIYLEINKT